MKKANVLSGIVAVVLVSVVTISFIKCGGTKKTQISLNDVVNIANKNRNNSKVSNNIQDHLYNYTKGDEGFTDEEVNTLTNIDFIDNTLKAGENGKKVITMEMAESDVNYLFKIFKYTYGGYQYFGGDEVFDKAKENILSSIKNENELTVGKVQGAIQTNIDFIKDGGFYMDNLMPYINDIKCYYYSENYEFNKDEKGFYTVIGNDKYYLKAADDNSKVSDYMRLTINKDGNVVYNVGLLQNVLTPKTNIKIKLVNDNKEISKDVSVKRSDPASDSDTGVNKQKLNGIPVVKCTRMCSEGDNDTTCKLFAETGKELKNEPVCIVDLRGNYGSINGLGGDIAGIEWFKGYTGKQPIISQSSAQLYSKMYVKNSLNYTNKMLAQKESLSVDQYNYYLDLNKKLTAIDNSKDFNKWESVVSNASTVNNKNIVFVLIDKPVRSYGETFVSYLRTLKNVVFVGTNTMGAGTVSNNYTYKLPNTGMYFYFGTGLTFKNDYQEGTGFTPDLWVNSDDALDRVMKLIANNKKN